MEGTQYEMMKLQLQLKSAKKQIEANKHHYNSQKNKSYSKDTQIISK